MRVIFLAERPCVLSVNGLYLGSVDGFERSAELDPKDGVFLDFRAPACLPVCFRFDEKFLLHPPEGVTLYYVGEGVALSVGDFLRADASMRVIWQERLGGSLATLYVQGRVQLTLQNEAGFFLFRLSDAFERAALSMQGANYLLEGEGMFLLFTREGRELVRSEGTILSRENGITAEIPFHDSMGHTAVCRYENGVLAEAKIRSRLSPTPATYALALFESALIGADCTPFLGDALKEKAGALKEYLGAYTAAVPLGDAVGLVYPVRERVFEVRPYAVTLGEDGKIENLRPVT